MAFTDYTFVFNVILREVNCMHGRAMPRPAKRISQAGGMVVSQRRRSPREALWGRPGAAHYATYTLPRFTTRSDTITTNTMEPRVVL